jgi:hypothetical protein
LAQSGSSDEDQAVLVLRTRGTSGARPAATQAWRRTAARRRNQAGVLQSRRGRHQDSQQRTASTTVSSRGGEGDATRQSARRRGSGAPVSRSRRNRAQARLQEAPVDLLPSGEGVETTAWRREATGARVNGGGSTTMAVALVLRVSAAGAEFRVLGGAGRRLK